MEIDISRVGGTLEEVFCQEQKIGEGMDAEKVLVYKVSEEGKAFLVVRKNTVEVRTDRKLSAVLREKYESVMESRYFGRGGVEIVLSGQLSEDEIYDLVRLSYNLTLDEEN